MSFQTTPERTSKWDAEPTAEKSHRQFEVQECRQINLKERCLTMVQKITELEIKNREKSTTITHLQENNHRLRYQIQCLLSSSGAQSLSAAPSKIVNTCRQKWRDLISNAQRMRLQDESAGQILERRLRQEIEGKDRLIEKYQQKLEQCTTSLKKCTSSSEKLESDNHKLRTELGDLLNRNANLKDTIEHLTQQLEQPRANHHPDKQDTDSLFSFGSPETNKSDPIHQPAPLNRDLQIQIECYKASVDGLLEENKRLKKSFHALFRQKKGELVAPELEKQIAIMVSILDLNHNSEDQE